MILPSCTTFLVHVATRLLFVSAPMHGTIHIGYPLLPLTCCIMGFISVVVVQFVVVDVVVVVVVVVM